MIQLHQSYIPNGERLHLSYYSINCVNRLDTRSLRLIFDLIDHDMSCGNVSAVPLLLPRKSCQFCPVIVCACTRSTAAFSRPYIADMDSSWPAVVSWCAPIFLQNKRKNTNSSIRNLLDSQWRIEIVKFKNIHNNLIRNINDQSKGQELAITLIIKPYHIDINVCSVLLWFSVRVAHKYYYDVLLYLRTAIRDCRLIISTNWFVCMLEPRNLAEWLRRLVLITSLNSVC